MNNWLTVKVNIPSNWEKRTFKRYLSPICLLQWHSLMQKPQNIWGALVPTSSVEFVVTGIARTDYHDIFLHYEDSDTWYKCKISYEGSDDSEKAKVTQNFLITAGSVSSVWTDERESFYPDGWFRDSVHYHHSYRGYFSICRRNGLGSGQTSHDRSKELVSTINPKYFRTDLT